MTHTKLQHARSKRCDFINRQSINNQSFFKDTQLIASVYALFIVLDLLRIISEKFMARVPAIVSQPDHSDQCKLQTQTYLKALQEFDYWAVQSKLCKLNVCMDLLLSMAVLQLILMFFYSV